MIRTLYTITFIISFTSSINEQRPPQQRYFVNWVTGEISIEK